MRAKDDISKPAGMKKTSKEAAAASPATPSAPPEPAITSVHQWTNGRAEVLILRCCDKDGTSHGGFKWPLKVGSVVEAPDWNPEPICGGGLHGWPWGIGMGGGKEPQFDGAWLVVGALPTDVVDLPGKCKARAVTVRFVGDWQSATAFILAGQIAWVQHAARGAASATGERGAASATGWRGAASATGESGAACVTGLNGMAQAGRWGCIVLAFNAGDHQEMRCAQVGIGDGSDGKLKAGAWYRLDDESGAFVECPQ